MVRYQFDFNVLPSQKGYWIDICNQKQNITAETLEEAIDKFVEFMEDRHGVTISKTARKRPKKMYFDRPDGTPCECGRIFKGAIDIDYGNEWKKKYCTVWAMVYTMQNVFEMKN